MEKYKAKGRRELILQPNDYVGRGRGIVLHFDGVIINASVFVIARDFRELVKTFCILPVPEICTEQVAEQSSGYPPMERVAVIV